MRNLLVLFLLLFSSFSVSGQSAFKIVPLGVKGGFDDGNLSAYVVAASGSNAYVCLDAGTVTAGIREAISKGAFKASVDSVLSKYIRAYFISHPHLDHVSGLVLNSAEDGPKPIYSFEKCINSIRDHYFNWQSWPNFGNQGTAPALRKYKYEILEEGKEVSVDRTGLLVTPFKLAHSSPGESAAFLLRNGENYLLYFGDTGPDSIENSGKMRAVWEKVAPLVSQGKLKGVMLEVSYPNSQPDKSLYGHLTPKWFMQELNVLANLAGKESLKNLNVIVTHIKPVGENEQLIRQELQKQNTLNLRLLFPVQGVPIEL